MSVSERERAELEVLRRMRAERDEHLESNEGPRDKCATDSAYTGIGGGAPLRPGAEGLTLENVEDAFTYHKWDSWQEEAGTIVREALVAASKAILRVVPAGPSRTIALNDLMNARMRCNQSITFRGRF